MEHDQKEQAPHVPDRLFGGMGDLHADRLAGGGKRYEERDHGEFPQLQPEPGGYMAAIYEQTV